MRKIDLIIIHCSAVRPSQTSSAREIDAWHRARGWKGIGYHYVIRRDGSIERGRAEDMIGAHCSGYNAHSIGICYEGGLDDAGKPADTRTLAQKASLIALVRELIADYPSALVKGHSEMPGVSKACPCFDVSSLRSELGLDGDW